MLSNDVSVVADNQARSRSDLRPGVGSNLHILLMLGICAFPLLTLYSLADSRRASAHGMASAVVAKVRISRAPGEARLLVRSPLPQPVAPKPVSAPIR